MTGLNYLQIQFLTVLFSQVAYETPHGFRIHFYYNNEWHQVNLPKLRSHPVTVNAYDYADREITHDLIQKGIAYKFYGVKTTPQMLGYNFIKFEGFDSTTTFERDQKIVI